VPSGLAGLSTHQRLLLGVLDQDLAQPTPDGSAHAIDGGAEMGMVGLDVLGPDPAQEVAVECAIGDISDADVIEKRGPPDEIHLVGHVGCGHTALGEIVDQGSHPGLTQVVDHRDDAWQHGKSIAPLGQRDQSDLQIGRRHPQQVATIRRRGEPGTEPDQVTGEGLVRVLGLVDAGGHLRTSSGSSQMSPHDSLLLGGLER